MNLLYVLGILVAVAFLVITFMAFRSKMREEEEPDTVPTLINYRRQHSDGHKFLKLVKSEESETRYKFTCTPLDLNRKEMMELSKGRKFEPYVLYFDKRFVDKKSNTSTGKIEIISYPDSIDKLDYEDRRDPSIVNRINEGRKEVISSDLYLETQRHTEDTAKKLLGGYLPSKFQEESINLAKDLKELNIIRDEKPKK